MVIKTPRKEKDKRICNNCGGEIYQIGDTWVHKVSGSRFCNPDTAIPRPLICRSVVRISESYYMDQPREWEVRCILDKDHSGNHKGIWTTYDLEW